MAARLEAIVAVLWPLIIRPRPSLAAIDRLLEVHDHLFKLFGLDQESSCEKNQWAQSNVITTPGTGLSPQPLITRPGRVSGADAP